MAAPGSCLFFAGHLRLLLLLVGLVSTAWGAQKHVHDGSFTPDAVLRVSAQNISIGGIYRYSTLINGTAPGPELRIPEGQVAWIRVYNDMTDQNTTIVSFPSYSLSAFRPPFFNSHTIYRICPANSSARACGYAALARPRAGGISLLRRDAASVAVADPAAALLRL